MKAILRIIRQSIECGHAVEIEGLGTFRKGEDGKYQLEPQTRPQVFVAYAVEDLIPARRLCEALRAAGCSPWLDKDKLLPGQNWPRSIEQAIEISDVFVACFSSRSIRKRGQFQSELRYALECARQLPLDSIFLIPVRLERCEIPLRISDHVQYIDLSPDWEQGFQRLLDAIRRSMRQNMPIRSRLVCVPS